MPCLKPPELMNITPAQKCFFGGLESLRGLAALLVVFYHLAPLIKNPVTSCCFVKNGYLMVDMFFILSGFVIFHNYGTKLGSMSEIGRFMMLRFGRLYPLHLATLLLFLIVETAKYVGESRYGMVPHETTAFSLNSTSAFIANLFLVQSFLASANFSFNTPSWSISTEFYTYIVFGLAVFFAPSRMRMRLTASGIILLMVSLLCYNHSYWLGPQPGLCFLRCVLGFFIGVLAYDFFMACNWVAKWGNTAGLFVVLASAALLALKPPESAGWDYLVLPLFATLIVVVAGSAPGVLTNILNSGPLRWLGKVSYSIYMVHLFVEMITSRLYVSANALLLKHVQHGWPAGISVFLLGIFFILLTVAAVLLLSQLTYKWIEIPFQKDFRRLSEIYFSGTSPVEPKGLADQVGSGVR